MPTYNPQQLGYTSFQRSNVPATFDEYDKPSIFICWMDLLGVRSMEHSQITNAVDGALLAASEASSTGAIWSDGVLVGTPDSAIQYCLIGDALVLVEKDMPNVRAAAFKVRKKFV